MRMHAVKSLALLLACVLAPAAVYAQASIAGTVKDTSGAVLPGVTVEASSPALIEKTRSTVSDGSGEFKIENLRPGTYGVTFTLTGFNTVKRDGIELTGTFTAAVNAELKVGSVEETITVTGETPIVDIQGVTKQRVLGHDVVDALPTAKVTQDLAQLIPGVKLDGGTQDVGGSQGYQSGSLTIHGSHGDAQRITQNGISNATLGANGDNRSAAPNMGAVQEVVVDTSAVSAELSTGGVRLNLIPREGGNTFRGAFFGSFAPTGLQGNNLTDDLLSRGLKTPGANKESIDINPGFGGPLMKDKLWFYGTARYLTSKTYAAGVFNNANFNNPAVWTYTPGTTPQSNDSIWKDAQLRITWQANQKNKISLSYDQPAICRCPAGISATTAPEASLGQRLNPMRAFEGDWTSPITNRLLFDFAFLSRIERRTQDSRGDASVSPSMISVTEQSSGLTYRAPAQLGDLWTNVLFYRASLSYVTGSHSVKVGFNNGVGHQDSTTHQMTDTTLPVSFRFNNGVPNQLTERATPYTQTFNQDSDLGIFAQDKWTLKRLTTTVGLRYDHFANSFPAATLGPGPLTPTRNLALPAVSNLNWNDITPKMGVSYDVFGTGRTALKVTLNKYVAGYGTSGIAVTGSPVNTLVLSTTRTWTDTNRNFTPDCNLLNPAAQTVAGGDVCGALANANFGTSVPGTTVDPSLLTGWGKRDYNWEFSTGVQHQILPRVSVDIWYFRRWFGNFQVTDNLAVAQSDYNQYTLTAPSDSRLPNGGGYAISGINDLNPSKFGVPSQNFITSTDNYGNQIERWNGIDVSFNARPRPGVVFQGGVSTGKTVTDNCDIAVKVPEAVGSTPLAYCHTETPFIADWKFLGTYLVPKIDVNVSGTFQSIAGPAIAANFVAANALIQPSLGRPLSGGAANATINLVTPGTIYGERLNQVDLRIGKALKFGTSRASVNFDTFNLFNASTVLTENAAFALWRQPTSIVTGRFAKLSFQFDF